MTESQTVLIIDDEVQIRRLIRITLEANGYVVKEADTGEAGLVHAATDRPDAILLDLGLPDGDGITILKRLREWATMPVIILTVRSGEQDIVSCLDAGADDYLTKPFRTGELLARLRNTLRHHTTPEEEPSFTVGDLFVDLASRRVKKKGVPVKLTEKEYALLALFVRHAGKLLTHRYILEQVWGPTFAEEAQYTRVYISQLRKKLEDDPVNPKLILTESGVGYRLNVEE